MIGYKKFIEKSFDIINKAGERVPFILNPVQKKLLADLSGKDIILKARQEGLSSLVIAVFLVDFLTVENSRSVIISHEAGATVKLFDRSKFFLTSLIDKGVEIPLKYDSRNEMVCPSKNSVFYIQTAGAKALLRGETISNLHFSEPAFYETDPEKICLGAMQSVVPGGRIVFESTANGVGNYFHKEWERAKRGESNFKPHFFGRDFYSREFLDEKRKEFADEALFYQEYPLTPDEAFISSGRPFFNPQVLKWYREQLVKPPIQQGYLLAGNPPTIDGNKKGYWKFWELPQEGEGYLISCDIGEKSDYSAAGILKRRTLELVATLHGGLDSGELAHNLAMAGQWFNNALIAPEKNGLGMGVLTALKGLNYTNIYQRQTFDRITNETKNEQGWLTTSSTRSLMLADLQSSLNDKGIKIYDEACIKELMTFYRDEKTGKPEAQRGCHDDRVIMLAILARLVQETPVVVDTWDDAIWEAQQLQEKRELGLDGGFF